MSGGGAKTTRQGGKKLKKFLLAKPENRIVNLNVTFSLGTFFRNIAMFDGFTNASKLEGGGGVYSATLHTERPLGGVSFEPSGGCPSSCPSMAVTMSHAVYYGCATNLCSLFKFAVAFCFCESHIQTIQGEYTQKTKIQKVKCPKMSPKLVLGIFLRPFKRSALHTMP